VLKTFPATMTTGELYEGNQQFAGTGITKWCALCGKHKTPGGGFLKFVLGGRHWVCSLHPKAGSK